MSTERRPPTEPSGTVRPEQKTPGAGENICPDCGGTGRKQDERCPRCDGTGKVIEGIGGA